MRAGALISFPLLLAAASASAGQEPLLPTPPKPSPAWPTSPTPVKESVELVRLLADWGHANKDWQPFLLAARVVATRGPRSIRAGGNYEERPLIRSLLHHARNYAYGDEEVLAQIEQFIATYPS